MMSVTANPDRTNRRRHGHAGNGSCSACMLPDQSSASSRERRDRARAEDSCAQKKNKKKTNIRNGATKEVSSSATAVERRTHSLHTLRQPTDLGFHLADRKRRQPIGERLNVGHRQRTCPAANTRVGTRTGSATTHTHTHTHTLPADIDLSFTTNDGAVRPLRSGLARSISCYALDVTRLADGGSQITPP